VPAEGVRRISMPGSRLEPRPVPAAPEPAALAGAPPGRRRKQRRCLRERPRQAGHQGGTGHALSPGQQLAAAALAYRRQQPAPGGVERQPGPGPGRQLKARHNVKPAGAQAQDRHVGRRPLWARSEAGIWPGPRELEGGQRAVEAEGGAGHVTGDRDPPGRQRDRGCRPPRVQVDAFQGAGAVGRRPAAPCRPTSRTWPAAPSGEPSPRRRSTAPVLESRSSTVRRRPAGG
jgi:hypothetical protein